MTQGVTNPPSSPFNSILARGRKSVRTASLFSLFSFAIFLQLEQTNFSKFRRTLSTGFDCWLCYFRYLRRRLSRRISHSAMTHHPHVALSRPLHPPGRHLKPPLDRMRPERRHLQVEGLQARRSRALSGDDACRPRVHPPLSHARTARRLSTASATMACSPAAIAPRTSPALANCSCRQSFPSMPSRQLAPSCSAAER